MRASDDTSREHPVSIAQVRAALDEVVRVMKTIPAVWDSPEPANTRVEAQLSGRTSLEQYIVHLEKSLGGQDSWGVAWLNYGWALELSGRPEDAFVARRR